MSANETTFTTVFPVIVHVRPASDPAADWQELDRGEGIIHLPEGHELSIRIHNIGDADLARLIKEIAHLKALTYLNLSENRKITDDGVKLLKALPQLTRLNLSSCSLTNQALDYLKPLARLEFLDISYCNRLTDPGLKFLKNLPRLSYIDLQGCVKITNGGLARLRRPNLEIHS
jgi:Leucine-rich repeat (LRR) protein